MKDRFYYRNGFIVERTGKEDLLVADFKRGCTRITQQSKQEKRIIKLLNLGYDKSPHTIAKEGNKDEPQNL